MWWLWIHGGFWGDIYSVWLLDAENLSLQQKRIKQKDSHIPWKQSDYTGHGAVHADADTGHPWEASSLPQLGLHPPSLSFPHSLFYISHSHTISSASPKYIKQLLCLLFWRKGLYHIGKAGLDHISLLPGTPECWEEKPCVCQHAQHKWALPVLNVGSISVHVSPFFQAFSHIWV